MGMGMGVGRSVATATASASTSATQWSNVSSRRTLSNAASSSSFGSMRGITANGHGSSALMHRNVGSSLLTRGVAVVQRKRPYSFGRGNGQPSAPSASASAYQQPPHYQQPYPYQYQQQQQYQQQYQQSQQMGSEGQAAGANANAQASYPQPQQPYPGAIPPPQYSYPTAGFLPAWLGTARYPLIIRPATPSIPWLASISAGLGRAIMYIAFFIGVTWLVSYVAKGMAGGIMGGGTKDFLIREKSKITFSDVKGCDEAKEEMKEVVEFLKNPEKFSALGGKMTRGVLLTGPPGTGKTLLAKAVAGEAGVPFFAASGSDFDEVFVGVGASRVRELFAAARKQGKAIIFIDEIDACGGSRERLASSSSRGTINALLAEMDGFSSTTGIIVIGATNHPRSLDAALVRPGRFDRHVAVSLPDAEGRYQILSMYGKKMKLAPDVDLRLLSQSTPGFTGADLFNMLNGAAIRASASGKSHIDHDEIEYAYDKLLMGAERSFTQSPEAKRNTAYHEAGHTIMLLHTPGAPPLHKVTILPRGRALGAMFHLPTNEHHILTRQQLMADIDVSMGGRVAEELLHGPERITSGASNDLEQASAKARYMITALGMGSNTGLMTLPRSHTDGTNPAQLVAPSTLSMMDREVKALLAESYERTKRTLTEHMDEWHRLAQALIEHEVLDAKQVREAVEGKPVRTKIVNKFRQTQPSSSGDREDGEGQGGLQDKEQAGQGREGIQVPLIPKPVPRDTES